MQKTLVLIRHGHRDNSRRELNNGLDEKGREQAKALRRFFLSRFQGEDLKNGLWLVSSPKLRCVETLQPLAKAVEKKIDIHPDLDEGANLANRVGRFLDEWKKSPMVLTVLCSHGDWIPQAAEELLGAAVDPKKGSWLELESNAGAALLKWYIPSFKPFQS